MSARLGWIAVSAIAFALAQLLPNPPGASAEEEPPAPQLILPIPDGQMWRITCAYTPPEGSEAGGCGHSGQPWNRYAIDLQHVEGARATIGQPILAAAGGRVRSAGAHTGLGWHVILDHGGGYATVYGHMAAPPFVREGEDVQQGRVLGVVGCTGACTGPHIHFALWKHSVSVLPEPICGLRNLGYGQVVEGCASAPPSTLAPGPMAFVGADFDGDGLSDGALFYEIGVGETRIDVLRLGSEQDIAGIDAWWQSDGYWPGRVPQVLAGEFNGDGHTDLAALYDYGGCESRVHAFISSGGGFDYSGPEGWWREIEFCAADAVHAASGDFDGDGLSDIALFYKMNEGETRINVLRSEGERLAEGAPVWWQSTGYWPGRVAHVLPGDFDGDGRTDLAALYDYGDCESRVHVFLSTGDDFRYSGPEAWWRAEDFCAEEVSHAASGDFDGDGHADDLALLSQGADQGTRLDVLRSEDGAFVADAAWWTEDAEESAGVLHALQPGDFDGDGLTDLAALYDLGFCFARMRVFVSQGDGFQPWSEWGTAGYCVQRVRHAAP